MPPHPPEPSVVHPLPVAPQFVGRDRELEALRAAWAAGPGVVALVGLGGAGKTALAARFLDDLGRGDLPRPEGLFVWSFYVQPDAGLFLREVHRYFAGEAAEASPARGAGLLHLLRSALESGGPHLLVLDGLERVQGQGEGGHGRIEDPLLRALLARVAEGMGRASALITSRFPPSDLEPLRGRGYRQVDVDGLDRAAALDLLRRRGVAGDDAALGRLVESHGAHALTLDHLGGLIGRFLGGDPARAPEAPALAAPGADRQALRLARLLRTYEDHLPPAELALLCRLCLLRTGVTEEQLLRLFLCTPTVTASSAREAAEAVGRLPDPSQWPDDHPLGLGYATHDTITEALCESPLAGPDADFPRGVVKAVAEVLARDEEPSEGEIEAFLRLYDDPGLDAPTDRLPLPCRERALLRRLGVIYRDLREHPLLRPAAQHHDALLWAFSKLGWQTPARPSVPEDLGADDIRARLLRVEHRIRRFARKHAALARIREACRLRQRKWSLAGPLAGLDAEAIRRAVASLAGLHLVLREADGAIEVHPAVRDHFARLGDEAGRGGWHDLVREQLVSLARRPGRGLPEDKATLDLIEEAIHHALEAGRVDEARGLYEGGLGGLRHLGWKLGEASRGLRVLRGFRACPDPTGLGWFLRSLGALDEAYRANPLPYFRADVRLLQGRLPEVSDEHDSVRAAIASFLMGRRTHVLPPDVLGLAVPRVQVLLLLNRLRDAWIGPRPEELYATIGWEGDRARAQLLLAEVARRQADPDGCWRLLDAASGWVLGSGSVEHLGLWHLVRCRAVRATGDVAAALTSADEGVQMARASGLGLYRISLLNARAEILLRDDPAGSERSAREALGLASDRACQFAWGESEARSLIGLALAGQGRLGEARATLDEAAAFARRIGDPRAAEIAGHFERLKG